MDGFITQADAARLLGVSRKTFAVWMKKDPDLQKCLSQPMPRRRYISRPDFLAWKHRTFGYTSPFDEEVYQ